MKETLVSVIVPAFNAEATIGQTLASIAGQSHRNIEILIVDDGSTDTTRDVARTFCASEPRARLLPKVNGGVASARNHGIAEAKGRYVALIDADDLWHPDHIAKCLAVAQNSGCAMVFSCHHIIDAANIIIRSGVQTIVQGMAVHRLAYINLVSNGSALLLDRAAALAVGGYDERLRAAGVEGCEDYLLQLGMAARGPIAMVPEYLVGYRQRGDAMSSDAERMTASNIFAGELFRKETPQLSIPDTIWRWRRAKASLALARYRLRRGRFGGSLVSLATAFWHDPVGTVAAIHYDFRRVFRLVARGSSGSAPVVHSFAAADPAMAIGAAPIDQFDRPGWLARIEQARMAHLTDLDNALAAPIS
ncbi:MAG: glycosyltransferase family 2 protein [Pseudomonadota bacterium]